MWPRPPLTNANFHNRISGSRTQYSREIFHERAETTTLSRQVRGEARCGRQGREAAQQTDRLPEGREEEGEEAEEAERVRGGRGDPRHPQLQMPKITKINLLS